MALSSRSYAAGHFLFQFDDDGGAPAFVKSVVGGMGKGAILEDQAGSVSTSFKHLGPVEIDQIQLEIGMALSKPLLEWIRESWRRQFSRRNGAIIHADSDLKCRLEQEFTGALIADVKFPTLDGAAKEPAYLGVTLLPESVEAREGDGRPVLGNHGLHQKLWQPCNFRLDIVGVDCTYVNKIDSFSVTQKNQPLYCGAQRFPEIEPCGVDPSNIVIYMAAEHAGDFMKWYQRFVMRGDKDTSQERDGYIEYLGPDNSTVLFTVNLNRLGIHRFSIEKSEANSEQIKRAKIELYLESVELEYETRFMK